MNPEQFSTGQTIVAAYAPLPAPIVEIRPDTADTSTFLIRPPQGKDGSAFEYRPGQFNMLSIPGCGEAAISISSKPPGNGTIAHTIRFVGSVTNRISNLHVGDEIGIRGPFGTPWPTDKLRSGTVVFAAGGIGLAPLRPAIEELLDRRSDFDRLILIYGARSPADLLYPDQFASWQERGLELILTVDRADQNWTGNVGVVPMHFYQLRLPPENLAVLSCGPEVMMRFVVYECLARRIPPESIYLSLERNMKCGMGLCGRCQMGPYFICKDGPVFTFAELEPYFGVENI